MLKSFDEFKCWLNAIWTEKIPKKDGWNFEETKKLLKKIWNPELLAKFRVIVWWTAWKWTTVRITHEILQNELYKVASFSSPHISCFRERIRLWDRLISDMDLLKSANELIFILENSDYLPTFYSAIFFLFILASRNYWADILIFEVWLWWEFDCTNAIEWERISAITFIWDDHREILWPSLEDIATTKAKIYNQNTIAWFSYEKNFRDIFQNHTSTKIDFINKLWVWANKFLAKSICEFILKKKISKIPKVQIPARWEIFNKNWKVIILDWAHSKPRIEEIVKKLKWVRLKLYLLLASKDTRSGEYLEKLKNYSDDIYLTEYNFEWVKSVSTSQLKKIFEHWIEIKDAIKACEEIISKMKSGDTLLITWSFYLCWVVDDWFNFTKNGVDLII